MKALTTIELFAGAGGLTLGFERAGFTPVLLSENDKNACATLRANRPHYNIIEGDVRHLDFTPYRGLVDVITGGFPCQSFSYAGNRLGFEDARGTLFYEFARAIKEVQPLMFVGENVKGLLSHDKGRTLYSMTSILDDLGYKVLEPTLLKAIHFRVPQKRERLFLVGIRKDVADRIDFEFPVVFDRIYTLRDALKAGDLFPCDVPASVGSSYPYRKAEVLELVPPGGCWRDLPEDIQRDYMAGSFDLEGGKTGIARRLSWDEPCLTLLCSPSQKQTERCHPEETRPLTVREYARIQTFPDDWEFKGSVASQYRQIGNAVPVNLAHAMGRAVMSALLGYRHAPLEEYSLKAPVHKDVL